MEWMLMPLKRYAEFEGRSRRMEYWMFTLGYWILVTLWVVLSFIVGALIGGREGDDFAVGMMLIGIVVIVLGLFVPSLAVSIRRLHDQGKSGWLYLVSFIPYIGGIILLVLMCIAGDEGENEYGPDPKNPGYDEDVFA